MSNNRSTVLGVSVKAGEVGLEKIDGATGCIESRILVAYLSNRADRQVALQA